MKKIYVLVLLACAVLLQYCATKKESAKIKVPAKITYAANMQGVLQNSCSPCHFPPQGNKTPLNTYAAAVKNVDESIRRINLEPGQRGFMPARHPKLADSVIQVFVKWKADGLLEK
ncbi:hypothetical protein [Mucilaginibacter terrae]|uniref:Membrane protein n=1 Tax=Mucilaginibacter terrae TaxID=1955052 RepID=A0ABU3GQ75_9SPHI|nr:hypothetical protein [Mucilaginibacter terrae]MDT3401933.1 putative membrane protein [Mucilaginibacter terrae]